MSASDLRLHFESDDSVGWRVQHFEANEALNDVYGVVCDLATEELGSDPVELLGVDARVVVERPSVRRTFCGIVHRVEKGRATHAEVYCRVWIVPAFAALDRVVNSRIFQDMTVKDILEKVLGEALSPYGREADLSSLAREFPTREFCVQYQETDLAFVSRLMEEEGIAYHFVHDGDVETLTLTDENDQLAPVEHQGSGAVPFVTRSGKIESGDEPVRDLLRRKDLITTSTVVRDYDFTHASTPIEGDKRGEDGQGRDREAYDHGVELTIGDYSGEAYGAEDSADQSRLRQEAHLATEVRCTGEGGVIGFLPGRTFELAGHTAADLDGEYVITRVRHASAPPPGAESGAESYHNTFECIPKETPFRPTRRHEKPRVRSGETAIVVGAAGEEIHTDEHGRIKVQFHWDRLNEADDTASCWIRVTQPWAGPGWGHVWIPRIGMEVDVAFVNGDPDRPLVTGSLYHGENRTPYGLPDDKTKSTIKSNSSVGGGGSNELRFEDSAGSEEVYLHAQKDLNEVVLNDHTTDVGHDQTNTVAVDQTEDVKHDQTMTVDANRTVHVKGAFDETIDGGETRKVDSGVTETIVGGETRDVTGGLEETITGDETRTIDGPMTETVTGNVSQTISGSATETISAALLQTVTGGVKMETPATASITATAGMTVIAPGGSKIVAPAGATIVAAAGKTMVDGFYEKIGGENFKFFDANFDRSVIFKFTFSSLLMRAVLFKYDVQRTKVDTYGVKLAVHGMEIAETITDIEQHGVLGDTSFEIRLN